MSDDLLLRSVFLPSGLDEQLREMAFEQNKTKSDIIRAFLEAGLKRAGKGTRIRIIPVKKASGAGARKTAAKTVRKSAKAARKTAAKRR